MFNIEAHAQRIRSRRTRADHGASGRVGAPSMIVCHCRAVSERTIGAEVAAGAASIPELSERCGAGSDCGGCHRRLERLLDRVVALLDTAAA
jgi:bacterioferritin-associated ferredoxin